MGLIRAITGSALNTIRDVWKDYIYCDSLGSDILIKKGKHKASGGAGDGPDSNVITQGSKIAVNAGQMILVVENGKIIDFCAEPGGYEFDSNATPSAFGGSFGDGLSATLELLKGRLEFGGIAGVDQRVYYVNTKEIVNNKFGFGAIPYRDSEFNLTISLQGFGNFSFRISNPLLFFTNISGNVSDTYEKSMLEPQIKGELQDALMPTLSAFAREGLRYDELPAQAKKITSKLKEELAEQWKEGRGIEIVTMSLSSIRPDDESIEKIRVLQESRAYSSNKAMLGARVGVAQANAMETAAGNANGAAAGFMGMSVAQGAGGVNVGELMNDQPAPKAPAAPSGDTWVCQCGETNSSKFCTNCGSPRPAKAAKRFCPDCGAELVPGKKFCPDCGKQLV